MPFVWAIPLTYSLTECLTVSWFSRPSYAPCFVCEDFRVAFRVFEHEALEGRLVGSLDDAGYDLARPPRSLIPAPAAFPDGPRPRCARLLSCLFFSFPPT